MKKRLLIYLVIFYFSVLAVSLYGQKENPKNTFERFSYAVSKTNAEFKNIIKKKGLLTKDEWQALIDERWGKGLSTSEKLSIFDKFWNRIDQYYAGFPNSDVDWDSLKNKYRPEVVNGVSRGRFNAIMNHISLALHEAHTFVYEDDIEHDVLEPGVPLMRGYAYYNNNHFGAALTPLADSSLLVYKAVENHPLGLEPGDRVLGYEGVPWKLLYKELLSYELPIQLHYYGSTKESEQHTWLSTAGMNWHLFDTLDVIKYNSGDTLHLPTNLLIGQNMELLGEEQIAVPGVNFPDLNNKEAISWGIVEGTNIGYIYTYGWEREYNSQKFETAIIDFMYNHDTEGLIIDTRLDMGGIPILYVNGLKHLFNFNIAELVTDMRSDPNNHFGFTQASPNFPVSFEIEAINATPDIYDKPIAILTGPGSYSVGDRFPFIARFHPYARTFGKPTNGAFSAFDNSADSFDLATGWSVLYANYNSYSLDEPFNYLTHWAPDVDEDVWFDADDVANGEDTVVKRAIEWITHKVYPHSANTKDTYYVPGSTGITGVFVENPDDHNLSVRSYLHTIQSVLVNSFSMVNSDSNLYTSEFTLTDSIDDYFFDYKTTDLENGDEQLLPYVSHFTTKGPVLPAQQAYIDTNYNAATNTQSILLIMKNSDSLKKVEGLSIALNTEDSRVEKMVYGKRYFPDLNPGQSDTSSAFNYFSFEYAIGYLPDSTIDKPVTFEVTVYSNGYPYWNSSFEFTATKVTTYIEKHSDQFPTQFSLLQNYPNPFNPTTTIEFSIPKSEFVTLSIYNILGQEVATLVSEKLKAGIYQYSWDAGTSSSGVYFYKIIAGMFTESKKMILLR